MSAPRETFDLLRRELDRLRACAVDDLRHRFASLGTCSREQAPALYDVYVGTAERTLDSCALSCLSGSSSRLDARLRRHRRLREAILLRNELARYRWVVERADRERADVLTRRRYGAAALAGLPGSSGARRLRADDRRVLLQLQQRLRRPLTTGDCSSRLWSDV